MIQISTTVACPVRDSFRVQQVAGMFDLPVCDKLRETFEVSVPSPDESWQIGAIVGPSGSGKSTIARAAFGECVYESGRWHPQRAVIDGFGDRPIREITQTLTAVGFGSPPSWLKPYWALSTGERFRCELARALLNCGLHGSRPRVSNPTSPTPLVVFDEFTSVVDRTVAKIASAAVSGAIRRRRVSTRLVVVSCHDDILTWLEPDWVVDMGSRTLKRGRLRRPKIRLRIVRAKHAAWRLFARHHYLSGALSRAARLYVATWNGTPVACCALVALYGHAGRRRIHRLVTLPDFQGVGIGSRLLDHVANFEKESGHRVNITTSHPAVIAHCRRSSRWKAVAVRRSGDAARQQKDGQSIAGSRGRATVSFEFV